MSLIEPQARQLLLDSIAATLYHKPLMQRNQIFHAIMRDFRVGSGIDHNSFIFDGKRYPDSSALNSTRIGRSPKLAVALIPRMRDYLKNQKELDREMALSAGYTTAMLAVTEFHSDYYLLLPDDLHSAIDKVATHFLPGPGLFDEARAQEFQDYHHTALGHIKTRLLFNVLENAT